MLMKNTITFTIALLFSLCSFAQIKVEEKPSRNKSIKIEQWEVADVQYKIRKKIEKPFEVEAYANVTSSAGEQRIPLFYNGDNTWVLRYSSADIGTKKYVIESDIAELNNKKGGFIVLENTKKKRHGAIVLNKENPRHFYYEDGSHYFNLAFECDFLFALDYGNGNVDKTEHLLDLIAENGFNQIVMNVYAYDVDTNWVQDPLLSKNTHHNFGRRDDIFPYLGSNFNPDYSGLNMDFFKHFDKVISAMHDREIVSHLMIYVWNKMVSWPENGSKEDKMYYDYVVKRYQAFPNMVWDVSKEAVNFIALDRNKNMSEHIRECAIRTRDIDSYNRLVSVHDYGFCYKNKDVVDFISTQDWTFGIFESTFRAYNAFPDRPVFNIEHGGYEEAPYNVFPGGYTNAEACLRRNYLCLFGGAYTTYYWQGAAWTAIIYNPFEQPEGYYKPHFEYFKYMREFFKTYRFDKFTPMKKYASRSYNLVNYEDGQMLRYIPSEVHSTDIQAQLDAEFDYSNATKQWFNTITGEYTPEEKMEFKNKWEFWDYRPWRNEADVILIVKGLKKK